MSGLNGHAAEALGILDIPFPGDQIEGIVVMLEAVMHSNLAVAEEQRTANMIAHASNIEPAASLINEIEQRLGLRPAPESRPGWGVSDTDPDGTAVIVANGAEVRVWPSTLSHDAGKTVVQIDTAGQSEVALRVNLNEAPIWDASPGDHEHTVCQCVVESEKERVELNGI